MIKILSWFIKAFFIPAIIALLIIGVKVQLTDDFQENVTNLKLAAQAVYPDAPIVGQLCVAQAILESGLQSHPSELALPPNNNLFGIKGTGTDGSVYLWTHEYVNGKEINVKATFSKNLSINDSLKQHRHVLELSRYDQVWEATTFEQAAVAVRKGGYATDPSYSQQLIEIYKRYIKDAS